MVQNINLLEGLSLRPVTTFGCVQIVRIVVAWIFLLALIYLLVVVLHFDDEKKLASLETANKKLLVDIAAIKERSGYYVGAININSHGEKMPGNNGGFYLYLEELANFVPNGVWLSHIAISEPDRSITLAGSTIAAYGVSMLINALGSPSSFRDVKLSAVKIQKNAATDSVDFVLKTSSELSKSAKDQPENPASKVDGKADETAGKIGSKKAEKKL